MMGGHGASLPRRDRMIRENVHDTYKLGGKLPEPTRCPRCRAIYVDGRWTWNYAAGGSLAASERICSACHRIADNYPAGEVTLSGTFLAAHKDEILGLARNLEETEKAEHPMNRIIAVREVADQVQITTTDVHLPRRIGKAIQSAWGGELDIHFDEEGYFTSITWDRDG
jgi:hypothetical protein